MRLTLLLALTLIATSELAARRKPTPNTSPLDEYIQQAGGRALPATPSPGSLFSPQAAMSDLSSDLRAMRVDDLVTIVVSDRATALAKGTTTSSRSATATGAITKLAGPVRGSLLNNLAALSGEQQLQGQGQTSRETALSTTLTARVTHVLPNGNLALEGSKQVMVNSEWQTVTIRGLARWNDLSAGNLVRSDRLAFLEVRVAGKGVVGDAIRRPNVLYRLLLGLLPF